jgi:hypothetical protein
MKLVGDFFFTSEALFTEPDVGLQLQKYEGLSTEPHAGLQQNKNSFLVLSKEELVCILSLMTWLVAWRR